MTRHVKSEVGWVLVGFQDDDLVVARRVMQASGAATSVRLDSARILSREEKQGDVVGFWHTHPAGLIRESGQDRETLGAFCRSFGKSLVSIVETDGSASGWVHLPGGSRRPVLRVVRSGSLVLVRLAPER
ncbi:MAG: Mov34/MPN/PAD-1 family protein [Candidatus Riflebacteria bacterium]|nr:Mov34/MPN/PAD-1 family protein [Candidatus Riflebacteria bacterium]